MIGLTGSNYERQTSIRLGSNQIFFFGTLRNSLNRFEIFKLIQINYRIN